MVEALDDQDLVLEALPIGARVVERLERAAIVGDVELGLTVTGAHGPVLGAHSVGMVDAHEVRERARPRCSRDALEQSDERDAGSTCEGRLKKPPSADPKVAHCAALLTKASLPTKEIRMSSNFPCAADGSAEAPDTRASSAAFTAASLLAAA